MEFYEPSIRPDGVESGDVPRTRRATEKRRHVMSAAARLISEKGYHETSMRDIAAELGMSAASLYHYFPGKEDLVVALQKDCFEELLQRTHDRLATVTDPVERLYGFVSNHMTYVVENISLLRVLVHEDASLSRPNRDTMKRYKREYVNILAGLVDAIPRDEGAPPIDKRLLVFFLFGMMNWYYKWYHRAEDLGGPEIAEAMVQIFLRGYQSKRATVTQLVW